MLICISLHIINYIHTYLYTQIHIHTYVHIHIPNVYPCKLLEYNCGPTENKLIRNLKHKEIKRNGSGIIRTYTSRYRKNEIEIYMRYDKNVNHFNEIYITITIINSAKELNKIPCKFHQANPKIPCKITSSKH